MLCTGNPFEVLSTRGDSVADVHRHHIKGGAAARRRGGAGQAAHEAGPGVAAPHGSRVADGERGARQLMHRLGVTLSQQGRPL